MLGFQGCDRGFFDALSVCGDLVEEGSVYRFLAEHRRVVFPDGLFVDLFGSRRGRPSMPACVVAVVMVLQALEGLSDREAVQRLRCDVRWKAAAGLSLDDKGFHYSVLSWWRSRLRGSDDPERIFNAVRDVIHGSGVLAGRKRRALDSTLLDDAVTTQDTVVMITAQVRKCRKLIPAAAAVGVTACDYDNARRPVCDWSDPDERCRVLNALVADAVAVLDAVEGETLDVAQADAVGLLAVVVGQDVEEDPECAGRWRLIRGVAKGRVISVVDPQARHARKSRSARRDGYKAHVCVEPDTGLITAADLTKADIPDARTGLRLLKEQHNTTITADDTTDTSAGTPDDDAGSNGISDNTSAGTPDTDDTGSDDSGGGVSGGDGDGRSSDGAGGFTVLGDSAYASGEALKGFEQAGYDTAVKPIHRKACIDGGFHRDDFTIDTHKREVTCPAGHTKTITQAGYARFGVLCDNCPLRTLCTTAKNGRTIRIDEYEQPRQANKTRWAEEPTQQIYQKHRPMVERSIAWLKRGRCKRVPYKGVKRNRQWLTTRAAAVNLTRLTNLGLTYNNNQYTLKPKT